MSAVEGDEGLCLDPTAGVPVWKKLLADLAWLCMRYHCSKATLKLNLIDEMYVDHTSYERTLRSAALNGNIPPRNLEPCFLQTLFFNNHFVLLWAMLAMGTGSLR